MTTAANSSQGLSLPTRAVQEELVFSFSRALHEFSANCSFLQAHKCRLALGTAKICSFPRGLLRGCYSTKSIERG